MTVGWLLPMRLGTALLPDGAGRGVSGVQGPPGGRLVSPRQGSEPGKTSWQNQKDVRSLLGKQPESPYQVRG